MAVATAASVPGCSVSSVDIGGGGIVSEDGASETGLVPLDGGACAPGDVRTFVPLAYRPATPEWQDVCTSDQLTAFYASCLATGPDAGASSASCQAFQQASPANAACTSCLLTPDSLSMYGPLIDHGSFITENVGGCIELTDPGAGLVCARAQQALDGCELAACQANCPVTDEASRDAFSACEADAAATGCQMFATQASCAQTNAEAGVSTACVAATVHDFFFAVAPLFCGPPPSLEGGLRPDASTPDTGSTDAEAGAEAASDGASSEASSDASPEGGEPADAPPGDAATDTSPE